jgi:prepilin-type N-terminal cleavage/methylation domain-containing protein/prepilin-type processing-associated H-X9-DG protein
MNSDAFREPNDFMMTNRTHSNPSKASGFTLIELLVVVSIIALLLSILLPSLAHARQQGKKAVCLSNLHQLGLASQMYLDESDGYFWKHQEPAGMGATVGTQWWFGFESGSPPTPDTTHRPLDRDRSILAPYIQNVHETFVCPSFPTGRSFFFPKFSPGGTSYGYNLHLTMDLITPAPFKTKQRDRISFAADRFLFADGVHFDFYADRFNEPAYIQFAKKLTARTGYGHFRHSARTNVLFLDSHADSQSLRGDAYPHLTNAGPIGNLSSTGGSDRIYARD